MKTSQACKYPPTLEYKHSPAGSGVCGVERDFLPGSPREIPDELFPVRTVLPFPGSRQWRTRECSELPCGGTVLGGAGIGDSLGWVGISLAGIPLSLFGIPLSLIGIPGGATGLEQPDFPDGFMANLGTGPDPLPPFPISQGRWNLSHGFPILLRP